MIGQIQQDGRPLNLQPVENVTNIKLLAKAANPTNWWAVASEIRATSKSEAEAGNKPGAEVVNKDALNKQIEAVKALDKDNYAANDAWKTLKQNWQQQRK